jgi:predicted nucleotidyltransferase component of viral defense system
VTNLTAGLLARHTPKGPTGRSAALIDIAQDLLLNRLADLGLFEHLVFKGGTALRKLYAGSSGGFSTDLDFSVLRAQETPPRSPSC